jgi:hypothetical protein
MKFLAFFLSLPLIAGVDGVVLNRTSGKPQAAATVSLFKLGQAGMESLETVKTDASGKFALQTTPGPGPHLMQVAFDGVIYNKMMPPGSPQTGVQLEVYNSQAKPGDAKVTQHMFLFESAEGRLMVNENIVYDNPGKTTFNDPAGTLRFYLPPETGGKVKVMGTAPNGMPVERAANPVGPSNVYGIDFPIRPGETRFQLIYEMPLPESGVFIGKVLHKEGTTRLVSPKGVTLKGEGLTELGREPATQAAIYNLAKQDFKVAIEGTGTLRDTAEGEGQGEVEGAGIQEILPRVYTKLPVVLALAFGILVLGFVMLFRSSPGQPETATAGPAGKGKRRG